VIATRDIGAGEELTVDYALFIDESMEPFACQCGSDNCRELIVFGKKEKVMPKLRVQR
jgi:D-alanine-D-alanine ligase